MAGQDVPLQRRLVRHHGLPRDTGILVAGIEKDSPAQRAGLEEGDLLVAFDGQPVAGIDELHRLLTDARVGARSTLAVLRRVEKIEIEIVPEEAPSR